MAVSESSTSLIRLPQVRQRVALSRSAIYLKISRGEFPAPVNLGARAVAWVDSEISAWIQARIHVSRGGAK